MINAKEAKSLRNELSTLTFNYMENELHYLIKRRASFRDYLSLSATGYFCMGVSINFEEIQNDAQLKKQLLTLTTIEQIEVTNQIINELRNLGYKVDVECKDGNEYQLGHGFIKISW